MDQDKKWIKHRLYRQHTLPIGPAFIKDLSKLGRELSRVIIIDNVAENFQLQPENGIFIKSWFDDPQDTVLAELLPLLKGPAYSLVSIEIVLKKVSDVRVALRKFRDQMVEQLTKGIAHPKFNLEA